MECVLWDGQGERKVKANRFTGNHGRRFFAFTGAMWEVEWLNTGNGFTKSLLNKSVPHFWLLRGGGLERGGAEAGRCAGVDTCCC